MFSEVSGAWLAFMALTALIGLLLPGWVLFSTRRGSRGTTVLLPFAVVSLGLQYLGWPAEMVLPCGVWASLLVTLLIRFAGFA